MACQKWHPLINPQAKTSTQTHAGAAGCLRKPLQPSSSSHIWHCCCHSEPSRTCPGCHKNLCNLGISETGTKFVCRALVLVELLQSWAMEKELNDFMLRYLTYISHFNLEMCCLQIADLYYSKHHKILIQFFLVELLFFSCMPPAKKML